jgi:hypothetical protein
MEFYSATKNETLSFAGKWMELENIILSEVGQAQKAKSHIYVLSHLWNLDLTQMQQCYETLVTLRGGQAQEG